MSSEVFLTGPDALEAVTAVRAACREHDGADPLDEAAFLQLKHRGLVGVDAWITAAGFALRRGTDLDLAVAPDARRQGLGGRLADLACAAPGELNAWSHGDHPAARHLASTRDLVRSRELWVMRRPVGVPLPEVVLPDGVEVQGYDASYAEALLAVNAAAFANHPEQGALDAAGLAERMDESWFDAEGLLLAVDGDGRLLGFHWTKQHDADTGEVYVVGISPDAQGRGLGRVLTLAGLHHLERSGVREVILYVESDNTPARRLYAGLGFKHAAADTHVQYRRTVVLGHAP